jgi:hypothetical protein
MQGLLKDPKVKHLNCLEKIIHYSVWQSIYHELYVDLIFEATLWHNHKFRKELIDYIDLIFWNFEVRHVNLVLLIHFLLHHSGYVLQDGSFHM